MRLASLQPNDLIGSPMLPPSREWFFAIPDIYDPVNEDHPLVWVATEGDETGRFCALVAPLDACILNGKEGKGKCLKPPREPAAYDFAHIADTPLADGTVVRTARLAGNIDHFGDGGIGATVDHYANTGSGFARVRYVVDERRGGLFACGAVDPTVTAWQSLVLRASALSGDWRWVQELRSHRMAGVQFVNVPGFRPTVDRAPTRASCTYSLTASLSGERIISTWETIMEPVTAALEVVATRTFPVVLEGVVTGDYRVILPGALSWDELPLPASIDHEGTIDSVIGSFTGFERDGNMIYGTADFYNTDDAMRVVDLNDAGSGVGWSIELDADDAEYMDRDDLPEGLDLTNAPDETAELLVVRRARLRVVSAVVSAAFIETSSPKRAPVAATMRFPAHTFSPLGAPMTTSTSPRITFNTGGIVTNGPVVGDTWTTTVPTDVKPAAAAPACSCSQLAVDPAMPDAPVVDDVVPEDSGADATAAAVADVMEWRETADARISMLEDLIAQIQAERITAEEVAVVTAE